MAADVPSTAGALLELNEVHKSFGHVDVIKGITVRVRKGEHVVIFGPSGGGKSTLLRMMNLLEVPDSGTLTFEDRRYFPYTDNVVNRARRLQELRSRIGMVFQRFNLYPHLDALHNVTLALTDVKKMSRRAARTKAEASLAEVGLHDRMDHYPAQLSGGQQQRERERKHHGQCHREGGDLQGQERPFQQPEPVLVDDIPRELVVGGVPTHGRKVRSNPTGCQA